MIYAPLRCVINLEVFNVNFCSFIIISNVTQLHGSFFRYKNVTGTCVLTQNVRGASLGGHIRGRRRMSGYTQTLWVYFLVQTQLQSIDEMYSFTENTESVFYIHCKKFADKEKYKIITLKREKAPGIYGLMAKHLQYCHPILSVILSKLFQLIMLTQHVSLGFKHKLYSPYT